jgi:SAM-dependent methyltransferase
MTTMTPEMEALKARLKTTWMSGDYGHFAKYLEPGALEFLARLAVASGTRMLDVACGAGQIAIPAARAGVRVTGIDIASNLIEQARERARAEGVEVSFDEGDAEMLPYEDAAFDLVVSLIGAMFAPRTGRRRIGARVPAGRPDRHGELDARGSRRPDVQDHRPARAAPAPHGIAAEMG